ncbi:transcriptional regulator GutM [Alkalihalobacillus sp. CinArs1]|uniref:transcriptional regulator GutM n=1 Tax=Alkalihalobacillus sp. CinArs1 TaxID=2995314 RepID=UPI0022DE1F34|nr:transcriptional regulator GutM [Alkalihalobacillus sp. CinArs1]
MKLTLILCAVLVLQFIFSLIQIRYYRKSMDKIVSGYKDKEGYYLFSGMERRTFKTGAIALIVVDQDYVVRDCHLLSGRSVFSKFKNQTDFHGIHVGELLDQVYQGKQVKKKKISALHAALGMAAENALLSISKKHVERV